MRVLNQATLRVLSRWHTLQDHFLGEGGQTLAEYGLILAVISLVGAVSALLFFQNVISGPGAFTVIANCVSNPASGCGS